MSNTEYRIYPDGDVVHQDDFTEQDDARAYSPADDYETVSVPDILIDHIEADVLGK